MRVFARVVELGSISAAARRLGISTALASKYIGQLEQRLAVRLLNRTTRTLSPTDVGRAYYAGCTPILSDFDDLVEAVTFKQATPSGVLRIAGSRAFGEDFLVAAVGDFLNQYPDMRVELALDERMVDIVAEGFDLAVRVAKLRDSTMIARRLAAYPYIVCAAPDYLANAGTPRRPEDLADHACIINRAVNPTSQWAFRIDGRDTLIAVGGRAHVNTGRATATLVRAGHGVGLCLHSTVEEDLSAGRLIGLLQEFEAYDRSVYAVYPHSRLLSAKVRLFVEFLRQRFRHLRADMRV